MPTPQEMADAAQQALAQIQAKRTNQLTPQQIAQAAADKQAQQQYNQAHGITTPVIQSRRDVEDYYDRLIPGKPYAEPGRIHVTTDADIQYYAGFRAKEAALEVYDKGGDPFTGEGKSYIEAMRDNYIRGSRQSVHSFMGQKAEREEAEYQAQYGEMWAKKEATPAPVAKAEIKYGSKEWYAAEIAAREGAAKGNTLATPVSRSSPTYSSLYAPSAINKVAAAQAAEDRRVAPYRAAFLAPQAKVSLKNAQAMVSPIIPQYNSEITIKKPFLSVSANQKAKTPQQQLMRQFLDAPKFVTSTVGKTIVNPIGNFLATTWPGTMFAQGLKVSELKSKYEEESNKLANSGYSGRVDKLIKEGEAYQGNVTAFNPTVLAFSRDVDLYKAQTSLYKPAVASYNRNVTSHASEVAAFNAAAAKYESEKNSLPPKEADNTYTGLLYNQAKLDKRTAEISAEYNAVVAKAPATSVFDSLTKRGTTIESRAAEIQTEYEGISKKETALKAEAKPYESAMEAYNKAIPTIVNPVNPEKTAVYPYVKPLLDFGKLYDEKITQPVASAFPVMDNWFGGSTVKGLAKGIVSAPGSLITMVGTAPIALESMGTIKQAPNTLYKLPGVISFGIADNLKGMARDPAMTAGQLIATYGLFRLGSKATTRGAGYIRTLGKEYIPIEQIGYDAPLGYPKAPASITAKQLRKSFETNTLSVKPTEMSLGEPIPYVPKNTALPGEVPGQTYMWSGHPFSVKNMALSQGKVSSYIIPKMKSELSGFYGAPVLESYFSKPGVGQMPEAIGFGRLLNLPTAERTLLVGLDSIPGKLSKARSPYPAIEEYVRANIAGGRAYMPLTKVEYEAVLRQGNEISIGASKYYTKVGGYGPNRFGGIRIPIIEQTATGRVVPPVPLKTNLINKIVSNDYSSAVDPYIGGYSVLGAVTTVGLGSRRTSLKSVQPPARVPYQSTKIPSRSSLYVIASKPISASSTKVSKLSRSPISSVSYNNLLSSIAYKSSSKTYNPISSSLISSKPSISSKPTSISKPSTSKISSPEYTKPYTEPYTKPYTAPYTKPYTAPYTKPYTAPYTEPYTKPYTKPYTPPYTPPYSGKYTPPYIPPYSPPIVPLTPFGSFGSSGEDWGKKFGKGTTNLAFREKARILLPHEILGKTFGSPKKPGQHKAVSRPKPTPPKVKQRAVKTKMPVVRIPKQLWRMGKTKSKRK